MYPDSPAIFILATIFQTSIIVGAFMDLQYTCKTYIIPVIYIIHYSQIPPPQIPLLIEIMKLTQFNSNLLKKFNKNYIKAL